MKWALTLAVFCAAGCRRDAVTAAADAAPPPKAAEEASAAASAMAPPRCRSLGDGFGVTGPEDLEFDDAVAFAGGYAVGLVHRTPAGRVRGVALVDKDGTSARVVELGPTSGDAPPPRLVARGSELLVAGYALPRVGEGRPLAVDVVGPNGIARSLASIAEQRDDSFAFDLAEGLVVWDEASIDGKPRGIIRGAMLGTEHASPARDLSPPDSDAEMPRTVALGRDTQRYFVVWEARRPESLTRPEASASGEVPGELRAQSWLEAVIVNGDGVATGPVRRITPQTGHVSAYDVRRLDGGPPTLLIVARDDGEAVDGSGGTLLAVRLHEDGAEPALGIPADGLGRGAPALIEGPLPWLAWVGPHEEMRLLPLNPAGAPAGPPSAEPLLDAARPLIAMTSAASPSGLGERLLVGTPGDAAASLRVLDCVR